MVSFTRNTNKLIQALDALKEVPAPKMCNLTPLFDLIEEKSQLNELEPQIQGVPPDQIVRACETINLTFICIYIYIYIYMLYG